MGLRTDRHFFVEAARRDPTTEADRQALAFDQIDHIDDKAEANKVDMTPEQKLAFKAMQRKDALRMEKP